MNVPHHELNQFASVPILADDVYNRFFPKDGGAIYYGTHGMGFFSDEVPPGIALFLLK